MAIVRNCDTVDSVVRIAFSDSAATMYRANAFVTDTCNGNATHCKVGGGDFHHATTMACGIIQTNDVWHARFSG